MHTQLQWLKHLGSALANFALLFGAISSGQAAEQRTLASSQFTIGDDGWRVLEATNSVSVTTGNVFVPKWDPVHGFVSFDREASGKIYLWRAPFRPGLQSFGGRLAFRLRARTPAAMNPPVIYLRGKVDGTPTLFAYQTPGETGEVWTDYNVPLSAAGWISVGGVPANPQTMMCLLQHCRVEIYPCSGTDLDRVKLFGLQGNPRLVADPPASPGLDFKKVQVTGPPDTILPVVLRNRGELPLDLRVGSLLVNSSEDVWRASVLETGPCPQLIAPGESVTINIFFNPKAHKLYELVWQIGTNDPTQPVVSYQLRGQGKIVLTGTWICEGEVSIDHVDGDQYTSRFFFPHNGDEAYLEFFGGVAEKAWSGRYTWRDSSGDLIGKGRFLFRWRFDRPSNTEHLENPVFSPSQGPAPSEFVMHR